MNYIMYLVAHISFDDIFLIKSFVFVYYIKGSNNHLSDLNVSQCHLYLFINYCNVDECYLHPLNNYLMVNQDNLPRFRNNYSLTYVICESF